MMLDASLFFVNPQGAAQSMVAAAGAAVNFNNVVDVMGVGVGVAPPNIIGRRTLFGEDLLGMGIWKPEIQINVGTAFVTANAANAEFVLQGAPDTGAAGGYLPGTWEDFGTTGVHLVAELTAGQVFRMACPPAPPNTLTPRFYRMLMRVPAATNFTAGTISGAFIVLGRDDIQAMRQAANNYVVA